MSEISHYQGSFRLYRGFTVKRLENDLVSTRSRMSWKLSRTVVCPAKAGMFSRRQSCRGKSQKPRSLDSRVAGNQDLGAYRPGLPWGGASHQAVTKVNAEVAPKVRSLEGRAPNRRAKAVWASRTLTETARPLWRGGSDAMVARTC